MNGEFRLIEDLRKIFGSPEKPTMGIGDDAAYFETSAKAGWVWTTDSLVENVHFKWLWLSNYELGRRAAVASLSDVVAMGAEPQLGLVTFHIRSDMPFERIHSIAQGIHDEFKTHGGRIVGGNVTRSETFAIDITSLGTVHDKSPWLRSGAKPGDDIWVTGEPGSAALAIALLDRDSSRISETESLLKRWRRPTLRLKESKQLRGSVSAAIDISDGLLQDAQHLATASKVDLELDLSSMAVSIPFQNASESIQSKVEEWRCRPSDDYELLVTAPSRFQKMIKTLPDTGLQRIGRVIEGNGQIHAVGISETLVTNTHFGWDHFTKK